MQRLIIQAFLDLTESGGCQVIITTHVPGLAGLLAVETLRCIHRKDGAVLVASGQSDGESLYGCIADDLGVIPDTRVKALVCVEGPHDISFLSAMSSILHKHDGNLPDLAFDPRIALLPLGGSAVLLGSSARLRSRKKFALLSETQTPQMSGESRPMIGISRQPLIKKSSSSIEQ